MSDRLQLINPMRSPQWRLERAIKLADHRPQPLPPRRSDDYFVRAYRRFLMNMNAAGGDSTKEYEVFLSQPEVFLAHGLHFNPDREWHALLQSRILAREDDETIASRYGTSAGVIKHYEKIFYNVRDRFDCTDWMAKTILGTPSKRAADKNDAMTDEQRFLTYRLFAYTGGSLILDAVVLGVTSRTRISNRSGIDKWFETTHANLLNIRGAMAARVFEISKWNVMQLMELCVTMAKDKQEGVNNDADNEQRVARVLNAIHWSVAGEIAQPGSDPLRLMSPVEPRASELIALSNGTVPKSLTQAEQQTNLEQLHITPEAGLAALEGAEQ